MRPEELRRKAAAAYVGLGLTKFDELVAGGRMPRPKRIDGCVIWDRYRLDAAFDDLPDDNGGNSWGGLTDHRAKATTCTSEIVRNRLRKMTGTADYDTDVYEALLKGELTPDRMPPGKYPNGMRVYAEGEWEKTIRSAPMQKRELFALEAYFQAKGTVGYVKGGGLLTTERLAARGLVEIVEKRDGGRVPYYGITPAGEAEWRRLAEIPLE